jgi:hypothetical protein
MGLEFGMLRELFSTDKRLPVERDEKRFGGRVSVLQHGELEVEGRAVDGVIQDVGLGGAFFWAKWLPKVGQTGTLRGPDKRPITVRVVRKSRFGRSGVALAFDSDTV